MVTLYRPFQLCINHIYYIAQMITFTSIHFYFNMCNITFWTKLIRNQFYFIYLFIFLKILKSIIDRVLKMTNFMIQTKYYKSKWVFLFMSFKLLNDVQFLLTITFSLYLKWNREYPSWYSTWHNHLHYL